MSWGDARQNKPEIHHMCAFAPKLFKHAELLFLPYTLLISPKKTFTFRSWQVP